MADNGTLLGLAAVVSAVGGCASTILAIRKARDEESELCLVRLREARAESERLAEELHQLRMSDAGQLDIGRDRGHGPSDGRWSHGGSNLPNGQ